MRNHFTPSYFCKLLDFGPIVFGGYSVVYKYMTRVSVSMRKNLAQSSHLFLFFGN